MPFSVEVTSSFSHIHCFGTSWARSPGIMTALRQDQSPFLNSFGVVFKDSTNSVPLRGAWNSDWSNTARSSEVVVPAEPRICIVTSATGLLGA